MKKVVILGCENSHANQFMDYIVGMKKYSDIEVVGVYSDDVDAAAKFTEKYGLYVMKNFGEFAGNVDGVLITARHGGKHYEFAKPYLPGGAALFVDKPITVSESDAVELMRECKKYGVRVTGGSCCKYVDWIKELKSDAEREIDGRTLGGFVRSPVNLENPYGGFFFYSQHLVEMMCEIFGRYPLSVFAARTGDTVTVTFRYEKYSTVGLFVEGNWYYYAARVSEKGVKGGNFQVVTGSECFLTEFDEFYAILQGGSQKISYQDFIAPVFVLNAINRSLQSGREEKVGSYGI